MATHILLPHNSVFSSETTDGILMLGSGNTAAYQTMLASSQTACLPITKEGEDCVRGIQCIVCRTGYTYAVCAANRDNTRTNKPEEGRGAEAVSSRDYQKKPPCSYDRFPARRCQLSAEGRLNTVHSFPGDFQITIASQFCTYTYYIRACMALCSISLHGCMRVLACGSAVKCTLMHPAGKARGPWSLIPEKGEEGL